MKKILRFIWMPMAASLFVLAAVSCGKKGDDGIKGIDPEEIVDPFDYSSVEVTPTNRAKGISSSVLDNMVGKNVYLVTGDFYEGTQMTKTLSPSGWWCSDPGHMAAGMAHHLNGLSLASIMGVGNSEPTELIITKVLDGDGEWLKNDEGEGLYKIETNETSTPLASYTLGYFPAYSPYPACMYSKRGESAAMGKNVENTFTITEDANGTISIAGKSKEGDYDMFLLNANREASGCATNLDGGACNLNTTSFLTMAKNSKSSDRAWSIVPTEELRLKEVFFDFDSETGDGATVTKVKGSSYVTDNRTDDPMTTTISLKQSVTTTSTFQDVVGVSSQWKVGAEMSVTTPVVSASMSAEYGEGETREYTQGKAVSQTIEEGKSETVTIRPHKRLRAQIYYNQYEVVLTYVMVLEGADTKNIYYIRGKWSNMTQTEVRTLYEVENL